MNTSSVESSQIDSTSGTSPSSSGPDFIEKVLECPLCLSLICQPLSISCGHSFCRICLVKSLRRSKKKCPQCRAVCHINAEDAQENFMIKDLAMHTNPVEYAARLLEAQAEKSAWMTLLPIFYYNETLFPGGRLDLHLFEPRYRVMMQRVVNSTRSFAYVANFNQYRANVGDVALIAVLEEVEFMADGRCMLQAKLSSRMIITDHYVEEGTQGLHFCRLSPLADEPMAEAQVPVVSQLVNLATLIIGSLFSGSIRALEERYGPTPSSNGGAAGAEAFSLWMAAVCPLSDREKARLLKTTDTAERLRAAVGCFSTILNRGPAEGGVRGGEGGEGGEGGDEEEGEDEEEEVEEMRVPVPNRRRRRQPLRATRPTAAQALAASQSSSQAAQPTPQSNRNQSVPTAISGASSENEAIGDIADNNNDDQDEPDEMETEEEEGEDDDAEEES